MKNLCFAALLFFSYSVFSSNQESRVFLHDSTKLVTDVRDFLKQFDVARSYQETREDFLQRLKESKDFETVSYVVSSSVELQENRSLKVDAEKKKHLLGLFTPHIYAVKECGFWGGDEDGFHVRGTTVVGKNLARLKEKGTYEWFIEFPKGISGDEFANTPIKPLIDSLMSQAASEVIIQLDRSTFVAFFKGEKQITARLQYKSF